MRIILSNLINNINKLIILTLSLFLSELQGLNYQEKINNLTLEEKIGQLFIVPACPLRGEDHLEDLCDLIKEKKVGGILLKQGTVKTQRALIEKLQHISCLPLLCVQDGEWGMAMCLTDVLSFPRNLTLGAVQDLSLHYQLGCEIGRQCRIVGIQMNLCPVVDVNSHSQNPIIHVRSFGEDPLEVARRGAAVMRGIQSAGIIACAKHFPGHGDTFVDSHVDLPRVDHEFNRLKKLELVPFQMLIDEQVGAVMTAHLYVKALAEDPMLPATFSKKIVSDLLQKEMGFQGLVISDALNMQALTKYASAGQIAVKAVLAGHDLLLYGDHVDSHIDRILRVDIPEAFAAIKSAVMAKEIPEELINEKVDKILQAKEKCGLFQFHHSLFLEEEVNHAEAYALRKKLFESAITLVQGDDIFPLQNKKIALIEWGSLPVFKSMMGNIDLLSLDDPKILTQVQAYDGVILCLSQCHFTPPFFGLGEKERQRLIALKETKVPVLAIIFGTPYLLPFLPSFEGVIMAFEDQEDAQEAAAKVIRGEVKPQGKLPIKRD